MAPRTSVDVAGVLENFFLNNIRSTPPCHLNSLLWARSKTGIPQKEQQLRLGPHQLGVTTSSPPRSSLECWPLPPGVAGAASLQERSRMRRTAPGPGVPPAGSRLSRVPASSGRTRALQVRKFGSFRDSTGGQGSEKKGELASSLY